MIVLRRSPYDLIPVYNDRKYSERKIRENTGSEILGVIANDAIIRFQEKVFQINVSGKTISEVTKNVMRVIMENEGSEEVDWLELVRKNNDLGKFFVD
jgi:adenylate kinase